MRSRSDSTLLELEEKRLSVLKGLRLLNTPESESFDRFTRLAGSLLQAPIAAMSLTDRSRQWFKSYIGVTHREIPREGAPCAEVTATQSVLHIPDMLAHESYKDSPLAQTGVRFYAGAPLTTRQGYTLGALCVLDNKPRELSPSELQQLQDMAAMVMAQVELQHEFGRVDSGSGLPNRYQMEDDLRDLIHSSASPTRVFVLAEIADPHHINETVSVLGSSYLDALIHSCAQRIRAGLPPGVTLYHVGLAAFGLVIDGDKTPWPELIEAISTSLQMPLELTEGIVSVSAAFGVVPFDVNDTEAAEVLRMAISAVHEARQGDLRFTVYNSSTHAAHTRRFNILRCFRDSIKKGDDFSLVYQPRVDAMTGQCLGAEALLRWLHPELGNVPPGEFIPLIEQTNLAGPLTKWVLSRALAQLASWKKQGYKLRLSINISARNLEDPRFAEQVTDALIRYGISASDIELEFTESALIRHEERVLQQLGILRQSGVELAIDDFGTGYSSFSYISKLPAQVIKLDQSFIRLFEEDERVSLLVDAMIQMGHDLGYRIVAEGVETKQTLEKLCALGCDEAQGYFIARPLTVAAFEDFLNSQAPLPLSLTRIEAAL